MKRDWMGDNNRGIAILRVSSLKQDGIASHDLQKTEIVRYAEENGIAVGRVFTLTESAKNSDNRKRYGEALAFALSEGVRHILFYINDREARNLTDAERNEKLVLAGEIVLHYVRDKKILHAASPNSDFLMRDFQAVQNKHYSRELSTKVSDSMRAKAERGVYPSSHPPLGYVTARPKDEHARYIGKGTIVVPDPNPKAIAQVMREFELRAQGFGYDEIRRVILAEGLVPVHRAHRYFSSTIEPRLKNPFYEGYFRWDGKLFKGLHELIIPQELVRAARAVERGASVSVRRVDPDGHGVLMGGGWLKCSCGMSMTYDPKKKTYRDGRSQVFHYYRCTNSRKRHETMDGMNVPEALIWAQLSLAVDAIALPDDLAEEIAARLNQTEGDHAAIALRRISALTAAIARYEEQEDQAYADFRAKVLTEETFHRIAAKTRSDRREAQEEKTKLEMRAKPGIRENALSIIELCKSARSLFNVRSPLEKRKFLEMLISNPVCEGRTVRFDLKKPFCTLVEMRGSTKWWTQLDEYRTQIADFYAGDLPWDHSE